MRRVSKFSLLVIVVLLLAISVPLVVLAVPASGAVSPDAAAAAVPVNLADTKWVLSSLGGNLPLSGAPVTLQFNKDGSTRPARTAATGSTWPTPKRAIASPSSPGPQP